jgi:hypothetical protein
VARRPLHRTPDRGDPLSPADFIEHDDDLVIITDLPSEGPFTTYAEAETAMSRLDEAIASVND